MFPLLLAASMTVIHFHTINMTVGGSPMVLAPEIPEGLTYLLSQNQIDDNIASKTEVRGIVIGGDWATIEPTEHTFVWDVASGTDTPFDDLLADAEARSNITFIRIAIQSGGAGSDPCHGGTPCHVNRGKKPQWLEDKIVTAGRPILEFDDPTPTDSSATAKFIPPWDPALIAAYAELYAACASHLGSAHPKVKIIQWQYANFNTNDWNLGDTSDADDGNPTGTNPNQRWNDAAIGAGYATWQAAMVDAGKQTVTVVHTAFPNLALVSAINRVTNPPGHLGGGAGAIPIEVMNWAHDQWPGHIVVTKQGLSANVPSSPGGSTQWHDMFLIQDHGLPGAMQAVWKSVQDCAVSGDPFEGDVWAGSRMHGSGTCGDAMQIFVDSIDQAKTYSISWVEMYAVDLKSLDADGNSAFIPTIDPHIPTTGFHGTSAPYPSDGVAYAATVFNP